MTDTHVPEEEHGWLNANGFEEVDGDDEVDTGALG